MKNTGRTYSIGTVANMTGIPKHKLRHWCNRYLTNIQRIQIGDSHHRRFTESNIKTVKRINQLMKNGFTLKAASYDAINQIEEKLGV